MDEKKLQKGQEKEKNQDVLELIEDSLGDISGGAMHCEGTTNLDNYDHFGANNQKRK